MLEYAFGSIPLSSDRNPMSVFFANEWRSWQSNLKLCLWYWLVAWVRGAASVCVLEGNWVHLKLEGYNKFQSDGALRIRNILSNCIHPIKSSISQFLTHPIKSQPRHSKIMFQEMGRQFEKYYTKIYSKLLYSKPFIPHPIYLISL